MPVAPVASAAGAEIEAAGTELAGATTALLSVTVLSPITEMAGADADTGAGVESAPNVAQVLKNAVEVLKRLN